MIAERHLEKLRSAIHAGATGKEAHVVCPGVAKNVVQSVGLGYILGSLADDDGELDLIVRKVLLWGLSDLRNEDRCIRANDGSVRLVKEDWVSAKTSELYNHGKLNGFAN